MNQVDEKSRRPHLTKEQRLPSCYKEVEKVLSKVKRCEANAKTALSSSRLRGSLFRKVYALTLNVLKQSRIIDEIFKETQLLEKETFLRKELAGILVHELIFGKGLPGESKPVQVVKKYEAVIQKAYNRIISDGSLSNSVISIPKYIRVNTLVTTLPEVIEDLEYLGVNQIHFDSNCTENEFYELVKNLEKNTFLVDYHFKDLLVFNCEENLTTWSLYQKNHVFIQDKSSYIPAYVLDPTPGATVIDACAAPGMKTLHLTALMENTGKLHAFERDQNRFKILNDMLKSGSANICETACGDFNQVDPYDEKYSSVEFILLDPSCSGSGMVSRMDSITDTKESKNNSRIEKLAGFQIILLKHALLFPSVKRVVYSTCSITETENEYVVHEVLNHFQHSFKLSKVLPEWPIRGSDEYQFGSHCLRAYPDKCFTNGFFVAMFERITSFQEEYDHDDDSYPQEKKNRFKKAANNTGSYKKNKFDGGGGGKNKKRSDYMENEKQNALYDEENFEDVQDSFRNKGYNSRNNEDYEQEEFNRRASGTFEKKDKLQNLSNDVPINTTEKEIPIKKKSKHKKDSLVESHDEINSNDVAELLEEKPRKKKSKKKNRESFVCNASTAQNEDEGIKVNDIQDNDSAEFQESELHHKKHKKKHQKDEIQCLQSIERNGDIKGDGDIETTEKILHKKKRKHRRSDSVDTHEKCLVESQDKLEINPNIDVTSNNLSESLDKVKSHKKKNKRKHEVEYSEIINVNDNANETQILIEETEGNDIQDYIFTDGETLRKKHKKKLKKEHEIQSQNIMVPTDIPISEITEISPSSKKHKKKHKKDSVGASEQLNEVEEAVNSDMKDSVLSDLAGERHSNHKRHKSKHKKERPL